MLAEELIHQLRRESETNASVVLTPSVYFPFRIRPQQVAQNSSVRDIGRTTESTNLLKTLHIGTQASMSAEYLLINDSSDGEAVETICECLP